MNSGCLSIPLGITPQHTSDARAPIFNSNGSRRAIRTACRICFRLPVRGCAYSEWSMTASPHSRHATRPLLLAPPGILQRLPRCPLRRMPGRTLPSRPSCTRRRVLHPSRVEGRAPALLVVPRELEIRKPWRAIPTVTCPMPDQESSHERSAWSYRQRRLSESFAQVISTSRLIGLRSLTMVTIAL